MDFGMSRLGRVNYRESNRSPFLIGADMPRMQHHSEQTAREIDEEVKRIIDEGLRLTKHILESRRDALVAVSQCLIKQEVIDATELKKLIEESSSSPMIVPGTGPDGRKRAVPPRRPRTSTLRTWSGRRGDCSNRTDSIVMAAPSRVFRPTGAFPSADATIPSVASG